MIVFLRSQVSSIVATGIDFLLTFLLVQFFGIWFVLANALGNISGAVAGFFLGRHWAFHAVNNGDVWEQVARYGIVWVGYLMLNFLLLLVASDIPGVHYMAAKVAVAVLLGIFYNYFLQKGFVFNNARRE
ncbi:MAG: GtrA family protein [Bacteroidota bacterium]